MFDTNHSKETSQNSESENDKTSEIGGLAGKRLNSFLNRIERLEEEKKGLADDIKCIYSEAKSVGFDVKTMKKLIKLKKMPTEKRIEEADLLDLYSAAIGLQDSLPLN